MSWCTGSYCSRKSSACAIINESAIQHYVAKDTKEGEYNVKTDCGEEEVFKHRHAKWELNLFTVFLSSLYT